nr:hypothetical protein [Micromonospora echinofusca]
MGADVGMVAVEIHHHVGVEVLRRLVLRAGAPHDVDDVVDAAQDAAWTAGLGVRNVDGSQVLEAPSRPASLPTSSAISTHPVAV